MPRVKIDYVVSFSSESPEAPASNLLANEAGRGRWLCARGEASCSVLLQLARAVQISSITVGAHHAALVEVLVGRSETPNEPFQVLVASSVFLSPLESRKAVENDSNADRVRTFNSEQLAAEVCSRRWDRVRVVCSQPYNKHCKYGLSFIHIFSPEGETSEKPVKPTLLSGLKLPFAVADEESDDEFKPGALFAQHKAATQASGSTDAQIRQATSLVLKNQSDSSAKLVRTPIAKQQTRKPGNRAQSEEGPSERHRDSLMYAEEDNKPHDKIDRLVSAHKEQQAQNSEKASKDQNRLKEKEKTSKHSKDNETNGNRSQSKEFFDKEKRKDTSGQRSKEDRNTPQSNKRDRSESKQGRDDGRSSKKLKTSKEQDTEDIENPFVCVVRAGPVSSDPSTLLSDVTFALSGYENPRRGAVRATALALGAQYRANWGPDCTHLICAFPNTPKLRAVRSAAGGDSAVVVKAEWIEQCAAELRRLPWQWFATEPALRRRRPSRDQPVTPAASKRPDPDSECDTDDEIEKVLHKQKARGNSSDTIRRSPQDKAGPSSSNKKEEAGTLNSSRDSDVAFVRDERIQANLTVSSSDSDVTEELDTVENSELDINTVDCLPSFFEGVTFGLVCSAAPVLDVNLVRRYVLAYGGEIVEPFDGEDLEVDYVLCLCGKCSDDDAKGERGCGKGRRVRGDWLWRCHEARTLCSPEEYAL